MEIIRGAIMNKRGSLTVEAVISVSTLILVLSFLFQIIILPSNEDIFSQKVFDALNELDNYSYAYEKIGLIEITDKLDIVKGYSKYINSIAEYGNGIAKKEYLKSVFKSSLNKEIKILEFDLDNDLIKGKISYNRNYIFSNKDYIIEFEKKLFLFGDDKKLFPNKTLASALDKISDEDENNIIVYKTKTGSKYHKWGCFYLVRSTTDKKNITEQTLLEAQRMGLMPCKRCFKEK